MYEFFLGMLAMAALVIGLFFLRFYRNTRDGLFACFAAAFTLLSLNWALLAWVNEDETRTWLYGIRLLAFVLIIVGIVAKNRIAAKPPDAAGPSSSTTSPAMDPAAPPPDQTTARSRAGK